MTVAQRLLSLSTAFCFLLSLMIHVATFTGTAIYGVLFYSLAMLFMWLLLFAIFPLVIWQWRRLPRRNLVSEIFSSIPRWMKIAIGCLLGYVFLSFILSFMQLGGGSPVKLPDGRLVLEKDHQILRLLSPEEFAHTSALSVRVVSAELLAFYGVALIALRAFYIKSSSMMADAKVTGR